MPPPPPYRAPSNDDHERVSALFLGPKAENHELLRQCFDLIVSKQYEGRQAYFPDDPAFITESLQAQPAYTAKVQEIQDKLKLLLENLNKWSIPFYSPRYSAHMCVDQSLPAILGYLATMFYNPNNVAFEGGSYTTQIELIVGRQMCEMMGYSTVKEDSIDTPVAWGHITCDGTVANIESIWASRNLKFYPFSLRDAMAEKKPLEFIADTFNIETCMGTTKLLKECTVWELLNLKVSTVVEIPDRLYKQYQISSTFLDSVMKDYLIQTIGKDVLMARWGIKDQPTIVVPSTKHYSWPKGAALAGIGSGNMISIDVDVNARMDTDKLRKYLTECVEKQKAVYEVVAVIGTTEEGAVDRLKDIIEIRNEFRKLGLSFVVHADAAWGGYFASMLPPLGQPRSFPDFVPHVGLRADTATHLRSLKYADCITIDPHKAGYVPYPAGGLCYKDGRMRYLLTWTAPYIDQGNTGKNIGVYGVEGSKPGAAAAAVYLAHQVIGTGYNGYGTLLGEASFTCRRFSSHWAAMSDDSSSFIVVPLNRLPSEIEPQSGLSTLDDEKKFIRERILDVENSNLVQDEDAMKLLNQLGSDLNINAFACNFRNRDGKTNTDIEQANKLNRRIFERLSVTSPNQDPRKIKFYLSSTVFAQSDYGVCADGFKRRLGLKGKQDLFVLRNVVMSPFSTTHQFVREMADVFQSVLEEEVKNILDSSEEKQNKHTFLVQGTDKLFLVHLPSFHTASGRRQIILSVNISEEGATKHSDAKKSNPFARAVLHNVDPMLLDDIVDGKAFKALIKFQDKSPAQDMSVDVSNVKIVKKRPLEAHVYDSTYPKLMPFYLYGTSKRPHIDHMLLLAPNIQLSAKNVHLTLKDGKTLSDADLAGGVIVIAKNVRERQLQSFPVIKPLNVPSEFFFKKSLELDITVYHDPFPASTTDPISMADVREAMAEGSMVLTDDVYVDSHRLQPKGEIPKNWMDSHHGLCNTMPQSTKEEWVKAVEGFHAKMSRA